jgi:hypothetical protein
MRLALREIRMLKSCSHKNVVRLNEAFRSKSGRVRAWAGLGYQPPDCKLQLVPLPASARRTNKP